MVFAAVHFIQSVCAVLDDMVFVIVAKGLSFTFDTVTQKTTISNVKKTELPPMRETLPHTSGLDNQRRIVVNRRYTSISIFTLS
jgi:hypothetical protein